MSTLSEQYDWLREQLPSTRIIALGNSHYLKPNLEVVGNYSLDWYVCLATGNLIHFTDLASDATPPRIYTQPSPFVKST